ncbi:MAG: LPS export ABC transporter periplasmic protein LptC [Bdellovibrio bacteriovorus]
MWSSRQTVLAVAFALLGGLAWWLLERQSATETPALPRQRSPDYVVSGFEAIETDETGRPSRQLVAQQLRQFVDEDLAELDLPRLTLFEADAPPWRASSREGLLLAGGDEIRLRNRVRIEREGTQVSRPVLLETSELTVWPQRQYAQGDRPVRIESERDWLTAKGLRLWFAEPMRAELAGRAHIFIAPEVPPSPTTEVTAP